MGKCATTSYFGKGVGLPNRDSHVCQAHQPPSKPPHVTPHHMLTSHNATANARTPQHSHSRDSRPFFALKMLG